MNKNDTHQPASEPKKINLQEAIKQKLASKNQTLNSRSSLKGSPSTKQLKNQQTNKRANMHRRSGV